MKRGLNKKFRGRSRENIKDVVQELQNWGYIVISSEDRLFIPIEHRNDVWKVLADCECDVIGRITKRI
jgi:hypothetical protein